jgi:hypothetical protein
MRPGSGASSRGPETLDAGLLLLLFLIMLAVGYAVLAPLRRHGEEHEGRTRAERLAELELRKETKYAEIRDAEADLHAGKLSEDDHRDLDRTLRGEAVGILEQIDRLDEGPEEETPPTS